MVDQVNIKLTVNISELYIGAPILFAYTQNGENCSFVSGHLEGLFLNMENFRKISSAARMVAIRLVQRNCHVAHVSPTA